MNNFNRCWALALLVLLSVVVPLSAAAESGIEFSIRFFDRRVYYVESDPVYVQVSITNNSPATYRFKLADERAFSIDFDVRTMTNRGLEAADSLIRKRTQSQQVFFREIAVESGESFSFVEDVRDYVNLRQSGSFVVRAVIYPELYRPEPNITPISLIAPAANPAKLESNRLSLSIRPPAIPGPDGVPLEMDVATGAVLVREKLPPDQVVDYMLTARQKTQWEKFFLYLDLESMLSRDAVRRREWLAEGEQGRRRMIARYRQELQSSVTDGDIAVIPSEFIIERTQYNSFEGTVFVLEKFRNGNFTELKRYTYFLQQKDGVWTIVDYSVVNLGTE
ncbi:MAG: hypothetical protein LBH97_02290 [Treponema sp.]|jgi:hypothetical protein|nr:hypothetical protein [Treponema sp.]